MTVIRRWTTMFDLDTSIHIVGHVLVAICVEYFLDWWYFLYATSWSCQCSWDFNSRDLIPVYVRYFQPLVRSWSIIYLHPLWRSCSVVYLHHGDSDLCIWYVAMTTYVISCIMPIHGHCTLMYPGLLDIFVDYMQSCIMVLCWLGGWSSIWVPSSLHFWDGLIMYFGHRITPLISYIRGHLL